MLTGRKPLSTKDLAELLDVDPSTIRRWRTACPVQGPPFIQLSERVTRYRPEDVDRWLGGLRVVPRPRDGATADASDRCRAVR